MVLYPEEGISDIQKLQMTSAPGSNVFVLGECSTRETNDTLWCSTQAVPELREGAQPHPARSNTTDDRHSFSNISQGDVTPLPDMLDRSFFVTGVNSDFDFCQGSIKKIFKDKSLASRLIEQHGVQLRYRPNVVWYLRLREQIRSVVQTNKTKKLGR